MRGRAAGVALAVAIAAVGVAGCQPDGDTAAPAGISTITDSSASLPSSTDQSPAVSSPVVAPSSSSPVSVSHAPVAPPTTAPAPTRTSPPPAAPAVAPAPATQAPAPAGCYPLSNAGNCYRPGQFCRNRDHGATGMTADGEAIVCRDDNGWRWEAA